jgi:hypothetical protein
LESGCLSRFYLPPFDYDAVSYGKTAWVREKGHEYCNPGFKVISFVNSRKPILLTFSPAPH